MEYKVVEETSTQVVQQVYSTKGTSRNGGVGGNLGQNGGDSLVKVVHLEVLELLLMVGQHIEWVNLVMAMETFEV